MGGRKLAGMMMDLWLFWAIAAALTGMVAVIFIQALRRGAGVEAEHPDLRVYRDQLVEVVRQLESGNVPLSTSMELWERGEKLAAICQQWLDGAKAKIDAARPATD